MHPVRGPVEVGSATPGEIPRVIPGENEPATPGDIPSAPDENSRAPGEDSPAVVVTLVHDDDALAPGDYPRAAVYTPAHRDDAAAPGDDAPETSKQAHAPFISDDDGPMFSGYDGMSISSDAARAIAG